MSVDYASFIAMFPDDFTTNPQSQVELYIGYATAEVDAVKFGTQTDQAILWLSAHKLTVAGRGSSGGSGAVISETMSKLKVGYAATTSTSTSGLESTTYGAEFVRLRSQLLCTPLLSLVRW